MRFVFKMIVFPFWLITAFLALMLKWMLNLSAFVLALPMLYILGCGLYAPVTRQCIWPVLPITKIYPNNFDAAFGRLFLLQKGGYGWRQHG